MNEHNQTGNATIITIIVVAVLVIGGVITYALMADSGDENGNEASTSTVDNSESQQDDSAQDDPTDEEALPADFPAAVPIYEPSNVTTVNTSGTNYVVGFTTDSTKGEVVAFYETELASNGWSIILSNDDGRFTASNDGMNVVADVTEAGDEAIFTVTAPKQ